MSYLEETQLKDFYQEMIFFDHVPLIPEEDQEICDHETWYELFFNIQLIKCVDTGAF